MANFPPNGTLTSGLEFSGHSYSRPNKFERSVEEARQVIRSKLAALSKLDALISISLGERPPLFIDARAGKKEADWLEKCSDTPDAELTIKPHYIVQFAAGHLEPRFGLFKDAFFHEAYKPRGSIAVAIRFADLLTPSPPESLVAFTPAAFPLLPRPTRDIDQVKRDIGEFGYGFVQDALTPDEVAILKKAVREQAAGEVKAGVAKNDGGPFQPNQRIWVLTNKGDVSPCPVQAGNTGTDKLMTGVPRPPQPSPH